MNNKALTLSVLMAIIAVFFVQSYVESIENEAKKKYGTKVLVVTAKKDIREMETVNETMLELAPVPRRFLEPASINFSGSFDKKEAAERMKALSGSIAVVPIKKGEQISYNKLTEPGLRTGLSPQVTPGKRAVAVPVDEVTGVAKLVKPGDRVDVLARIDYGTGKDARMIKTILQDIVVLAVGRNVTNNVARLVENDPNTKATKIRSLTSFDGFASVTLEVEPLHAQVLALLVSQGNNSLILSLRNNDDTERVPLGGVTIEDVLGQDYRRVRAIANSKKNTGRR